jgi:hypothetical protein
MPEGFSFSNEGTRSHTTKPTIKPNTQFTTKPSTQPTTHNHEP